ncbi:ABC transporter substrate-binding protein [Flammeovirga kamogawensis]|uniref:ABC transporter substrate-binding protein n=1 Tax=Flammeovirga kamogawensis TaxID=373891 RepID=A0ABX8GVU1_9BACT|nr:ABC transporter substrate-binding protein [Flammeovirga kamogawensis]MBB6461154.1 iron complex transport system substrate-binding protein [Flammeovirga kamogawensis]QWG07720.1 ABC transporter substrate-binding protein [Flammeovirga kamogawensis]TRX69527.1 ABC transporter substrate-binding protein [Flammeovirga kamogawensis]
MSVKQTLQLVGCLLLFIGCNSSTTNTKQSDTLENTVKITGEQAKVSYAKTFNLEYRDNFKLLHLNNPFSKDNSEIQTIVLLPKGNTVPKGFENNTIVRIPIKRIITTTTAQTSMLEELGSIDVIKGYTSKDYMYSQAIVDKMNDGSIITVGYDINDNAEKIIGAAADLVMIVGSSSSSSSSFPVLNASKIPVISNTDWQENSMLGRAEWIKVFGALLNKEKSANTIFDNVVKKYDTLLSLAKTAKTKPKVITGLPYKGMWSVPGGQSYLAQALKEVHANYPWKETQETGSIQLDLEGVYAKGKDANFWINPGQVKSIEELKNLDNRYTKFKAFSTGKIYNHNKRIRNSTANDYWGTGIIHPELIVADLIKIFHPELLPEHKLFFYKQLK